MHRVGNVRGSATPRVSVNTYIVGREEKRKEKKRRGKDEKGVV